MAFVKGKSGNPAGRPTGIASSERLRATIAEELPDIIRTLVTAAKAGDTQAAKVLMDRGLAPLRAKDSPVALGPLPAGLSDAARCVLDAVADSRITPLQAQQILSGMGGVARIIETDELAKRIEYCLPRRICSEVFD